MNKEEIIKKYKEEGVDEGENNINENSDRHGFYALCFLSMILMTYQSFRNQLYQDIASLLFVFLSVGLFSRYKITKERSDLIYGILTGVLCVAFLVGYIIKTI